MPVSKKRKKKKEKPSGPPPPKRVTAQPKNKITRQQIIIYAISALVIISMAIGFLLSGAGGQPPTPTVPVEEQGQFLLGTQTPDAQTGEESDTPIIEEEGDEVE